MVGAAAVLVDEPVDEAVELRGDERVTVPLMMLSVKMPPPPTRRVTVLVVPREELVVVLEPDSVPTLLPVLEAVPDPDLDEEDDDDSASYRSLAVT